MAEQQSITMDYRNWRGNKHTWNRAAAKYDFPVTIRKIGDPAPTAAREQ